MTTEKVRREWKRRSKGATVIEYALIMALVAVALVVVMGALGDGIGELFNDAASAVTGGGEGE